MITISKRTVWIFLIFQIMLILSLVLLPQHSVYMKNVLFIFILCIQLVFVLIAALEIAQSGFYSTREKTLWLTKVLILGTPGILLYLYFVENRTVKGSRQ